MPRHIATPFALATLAVAACTGGISVGRRRRPTEMPPPSRPRPHQPSKRHPPPPPAGPRRRGRLPHRGIRAPRPQRPVHRKPEVMPRPRSTRPGLSRRERKHPGRSSTHGRRNRWLPPDQLRRHQPRRPADRRRDLSRRELRRLRPHLQGRNDRPPPLHRRRSKLDPLRRNRRHHQTTLEPRRNPGHRPDPDSGRQRPRRLATPPLPIWCRDRGPRARSPSRPFAHHRPDDR